MSRKLPAARIAALLLAALWPALASAQMAPGNAAPSVHPGTRLNFPPTIGGAQFERSYTTPVGRDVMYVYQYLMGGLPIAVGVYDGGRRVTSGSENPMVTSQFAIDLDLAERTARADGMVNFEKPAVPSSCSYGGITFRCIAYSALAQRNRVFSKLLLTGYHDHFVRIRVEWNQGANQTSAEAEKALQAFVPALMH